MAVEILKPPHMQERIIHCLFGCLCQHGSPRFQGSWNCSSVLVGVGEELQHEIPALEDHPAGVPENDSEAQPFIEGGGGIEIS